MKKNTIFALVLSVLFLFFGLYLVIPELGWSDPVTSESFSGTLFVLIGCYGLFKIYDKSE